MTNVDICIVGGGIVGLAAAALIRRSRPEISIEIMESQAVQTREDGKSVVLSVDSATLLEEINAWPEDNRPIKNADIAFSTAPGACQLEDGTNLLGYGVSHHAIYSRLLEQLNLNTETIVDSICEHADGTIVNISGDKPRQVCAKLVIVSCQVSLPTYFKKRTYNYKQSIIATKARTTQWPEGYASEKFTARGIVALVPRADEEYPVGVIVCTTTAGVGELNALPDESFSAWLNDEFGGQFNLQTVGGRFVYAPSLYRVRPLAAGSIVCIGGGATLLHPVGAQGLNLGLADARALATLIGGNDFTTAAKFPAEAFAQQRLSSHDKAVFITSFLALGARLRARPFRFVGGSALAALSMLPSPYRLINKISA